MSYAYFLRFRFEPNHYALVGRESLDGRAVLRIEYYPSELFREGRDIDMDFLPGRSVARVDDMKATMRMGLPFPGVWLPKDIEMRFRMTLAAGAFDARYLVQYHDYRQADVTYKVR